MTSQPPWNAAEVLIDFVGHVFRRSRGGGGPHLPISGQPSTVTGLWCSRSGRTGNRRRAPCARASHGRPVASFYRGPLWL